METSGQRFKKIRQNKGMSQGDFGNKIGLSKSAVSAVENDKSFVSLEILRTLFMEFDVNLNWLITGTGNMFNAPKFESVKDEIMEQVKKFLDERGVK